MIHTLDDFTDYKEMYNKIICGDALELLRKLPDNSVDLVLTDPPYGMEFQSGHRKVKHKAIENDDNLEWLPQAADDIYRVLKDNSHAYIFCSFHKIEVFKALFQNKFDIKNILIWEKNNTGMGDLKGDYAPKYEMCLFLHKGYRELNGGRDSNIIKYKRTGNDLHPTQKPKMLIEYLAGKSTNKGDTVLDPFMGSWTTAKACQELGRDFIGCDLEMDYCKIGERRLAETPLFTV